MPYLEIKVDFKTSVSSVISVIFEKFSERFSERFIYKFDYNNCIKLKDILSKPNLNMSYLPLINIIIYYTLHHLLD